MNILQIQAELLRQEYPHLLPGEDPDIERYFSLRNSGQSREALNLYQFRLKPRYPDDEFRTALLRLYRRRDPAYKELQIRAYQALGARCLEKMKRIITFVADRSDSYNPRDAYSTIKAAEMIRQILPRERYEAVAAMERLSRYSQALNLRVQSMQRATELIEAYLSDTLTVVDEERRRREDVRRRATAERRRNYQGLDARISKNKPPPLGNLMDAVVFSPADLANIEIPKVLTRPEDKTLAFFTKYWNRTGDQAFERLLFLYSRKFGVKNYDVFKTIQRGKQNSKRDDEILASAMSCIITGYYYSVMGDRYLQRQWAAIKTRLQFSAEQPAIQAAAALQRPAAPIAPATVARPVLAPRPAVPQAAMPRPVTPPAAASAPATTARPAPAPRPAVPQAATLKPAAPATAVRPALAPGPAVPPAALQRPVNPAVAASAPATAARPALAQRPATPPVAAAIPATITRPAPAPRPATPPVATTNPATTIRPAPAPRPAVPQAATPKPAAAAAPPTAARPVLAPRPAIPAKSAIPAEKPRQSVSERLQELSGRSYDVFQDRFLAHVRPAIRKMLGANRGRFFNVPLQAEDIVFDFLKNHYSDPYMNWEESSERASLLEIGFELSSLIPVIDECYKAL
ncbi:MAG: hypothetical protein LBK05_00555 [Treponema sp.]|jgi:hypothetical protein|nr:hypothetical protein [Treponema sp.]